MITHTNDNKLSEVKRNYANHHITSLKNIQSNIIKRCKTIGPQKTTRKVLKSERIYSRDLLNLLIIGGKLINIIT